MRTRPLLATAAAAALMVAVLPALPWFEARVGEHGARASGFSGSGVTWVLPPVGALALALTVGLLARVRPQSDRERAGGVALAVLGALASAATATALLVARLGLLVEDRGAVREIRVETTVTPPGLLALAAAALLSLLGVAVAWPSPRR